MPTPAQFESKILPTGFSAAFASPRVSEIHYKERPDGNCFVSLRYPEDVEIRDKIEIPQGIYRRVFDKPVWTPPDTKIIFLMRGRSMRIHPAQPLDALANYRLMYKLVTYLGWSHMITDEAHVALQQTVDQHFTSKHNLPSVPWKIAGEDIGESWAVLYHKHKQEWLDTDNIEELFVTARVAFSKDKNFDPALSPEDSGRVVEHLLERDAAYDLATFANMVQDRKSSDGFTPPLGFKAAALLLSKPEPMIDPIYNFAAIFKNNPEASRGIKMALAFLMCCHIENGQYDSLMPLFNRADTPDDRITIHKEYTPDAGFSTSRCEWIKREYEGPNPILSSVHLVLSHLPQSEIKHLSRKIEPHDGGYDTEADFFPERVPDLVQYVVAKHAGNPQVADETTGYYDKIWQDCAQQCADHLDEDKAWLAEGLKERHKSQPVSQRVMRSLRKGFRTVLGYIT